MKSLLLGIGMMEGSMFVLRVSLTRGLEIGRDRKGVGRLAVGLDAGTQST